MNNLYNVEWFIQSWMIFTALVMELYSEQVVEYNEVIRTISSLFIFLRTVFERKKKHQNAKQKSFKFLRA